MKTSIERRALWLLWLVVAVAVASSAKAQPFGSTLVATFGAGDRAPSLAAAARVEAQLLARRVAIVSMHEARDRFAETTHAPRETSRAGIDALVTGNQLAVRHAAFGRAAEVQRTVDELVASADRSIETLNRDSKNARLLLDVCLVQVRSLLHEGERDSAIEQAMQCRRLVPDLTPTQASHPANVIGVLAEADDRLRRMRSGVLSVDVATGRSCSVFVNGRHLGTTPFTFDRVATGAYRVQIDCGMRPGRVHVVRMDEQPVALVVDESFDQVAVTEPRLGLVYDRSEVVRSKLAGHAARLGAAVHIDDVVLVRMEGGSAQLARVHVKQQRLVATASLLVDAAKGLDGAAIGEALDALSQGRTIGEWKEPLAGSAAPVAGIAPAAAADSARAQATTGTSSEGNKDWKLWSGVALLAAGAGLEVGSWALYRSRAESGDALLRELPMPESSARDDWEEARAPMLALAGSGAAVASAGSVLFGFSPSVRRQSWWLAGTSGAVGAALGVWGAVDLAKAGSCSDTVAQACVEEEQRQDRGMLLLAGALPLMLMPLTKLVHADTERIRAEVHRHGVRLVGAW
jgi:hypothetical protein